ncbi:hypothetical protein C0J45_16854 [Silurus meridionalis]|uniref:Uncharacterized protein n=1 Tax=Silurus meridionalis TaxID=175797 RepID=A0A8T0AQ02_SILME|nr:hypothetical protein HF521_008793 [Silurus meridionalis]KAI5093716.1 hypothetical protein C0J45_16854 [Silurus meridionalis]
MHAHPGVPGERTGVGGEENRGLVTSHFKTLCHFLIGQSECRGLDRDGAFHHRVFYTEIGARAAREKISASAGSSPDLRCNGPLRSLTGSVLQRQRMTKLCSPLLSAVLRHSALSESDRDRYLVLIQVLWKNRWRPVGVLAVFRDVMYRSFLRVTVTWSNLVHLGYF